ncbi:gasdermin-E-like isoform X2 [Poeciliopsis prolifica]|uniref:gasdermin-E-like isoform X2 n=1 Tax=Poeciliopsis prolifica TaxID=188132 RepID=UPI002413D1C8|nr:gasdermin-E-like isoform X2 [Poeciliopsis prolifica]
MFSKATANFVRQVDPEGSLIHVSRVNDSHKLLPMAVVVKRNRFWVWQRPKYQPTDFTLGDLLQGDEALRPGVSETEFLTYKETYRDDHSGKLDTEAGPVNVGLEGLGLSKLESCFGKLKKEELDVKKLLKDSDGRLVDMQHVLVQQLEKRAEVLTVVKERILTANSCSVTMTKKQQCTFQGVLGLMGLLGGSVKVLGKDVNNIEVDSDVSLEIPSGTVIAYSIMELEIKKNGHYGICLRPSAIGGFESDSIPLDGSSDAVDGSFDRHGARGGGWSDVDLSPLADLPRSTRRELMDKLQEALRERFALSYLQSELEKLCDCETAETPVIGEKETIPTSSPVPECVPTGFSSHLPSAYLLVSAMEELPDETLNILSDSRPDFLSAFDVLMCRLKESGGSLSVLSVPAPLQDNQVFQQAEQLLGSIRATLRRDGDQLRVETENADRALAVLLGLSVHGLALLCTDMR